MKLFFLGRWLYLETKVITSQYRFITSSTNFHQVSHIILYMWSCDESLINLPFLWKKLSLIYKNSTRITDFFQEWFWSWTPREMDVNKRLLFISFIPYGGHFLETVLYNWVRNFDDTFKYKGVYWNCFLTTRFENLNQYTLAYLLFGPKLFAMARNDPWKSKKLILTRNFYAVQLRDTPTN